MKKRDQSIVRSKNPLRKSLGSQFAELEDLVIFQLM
jgi:hypothetical protein